MTPKEQTLTITDRTSGKAYNVPEDEQLLVKECLDDKEGYYTFAELSYSSKEKIGWALDYFCEGMPFDYTRQYFLNPSRFTVSFPNSLSKETVREVLKTCESLIKEQREVCKDVLDLSFVNGKFFLLTDIADRFTINLEDTK